MPNRLLVDTNVLLRFSDPSNNDGVAVGAAINILRTQGSSLHYCSQNIGEFWNVLTRPRNRNGFGLTPAQAMQRVDEFEGRFVLLPDGIEVHREWLRLLSRYEVSGAKVHDAHLVATMLVHGVTRILTFNNADFDRYAEIQAVHPAQVSA